MKRRTFLRCLPAAPAAVAAVPAVAAQAALVEPEAAEADDEREEVAICESCECKLYEGDMAFAYSDGPTFCEAHAPTWNDLKAMQDHDIADGTFLDAFDDAEHARWARESVTGHVAAGQGDVKHVWPL
jgi:hypothetical protein